MKIVNISMKKGVLCSMVSLGLVCGVATISFAESDTLKRLNKQGYGTLAVANEPPYSDIKPDGFVGGAAPDIASAVLNKLGVKDLKAKVIMYGAMIPAASGVRVA